MKTLPSLFRVAIRVLAVPASSAPVQRVFSHGDDRNMRGPFKRRGVALVTHQKPQRRADRRNV
ncbi:hypothetical protein EYF80_021458 [Liparis tanakae]|uniref:HAT C-terminal dimerisation domain-containing protein n=1 Tax=Liparis tanakae TaxID=230148 RepID=A0A4Z2HR06_9TELE|nr:hypothetical protein EYF80_021458 [Liparis tanakae]